MPSPELKPCPFCGGEAHIHRAYGNAAHWYFTPHCPVCRFEFAHEYKTMQEAVAAWNRRAGEEKK